MVEETSNDAASKADRGPTSKAEGSPTAELPVSKPAKAEPETNAKPEAKAEGSPKAEGPVAKPAKAKPKIKDKPEAKIAAMAAVKSEGPATSTSKKPAPHGPTATAREEKPGKPASAAIGDGAKHAAATPGAGPPPASGGRSWLPSQRAAWALVVILGLVIGIGYPQLIDSHEAEIADLRAQLDAEKQAIAEYPSATAALEAIRTERTDVEAQRDAAQAEADALAARQAEAKEQLTALDQRLEAQGGEIESQIAALKGERNRLDGLVRATGDDLQAAMALIEAARGRMSQ